MVCCSPWGCKQLDTTWWLNNNSVYLLTQAPIYPSPQSFPFGNHKFAFSYCLNNFFLWLCQVFTAVHGLLVAATALAVEHRLSSCGTWA